MRAGSSAGWRPPWPRSFRVRMNCSHSDYRSGRRPTAMAAEKCRRSIVDFSRLFRDLAGDPAVPASHESKLSIIGTHWNFQRTRGGQRVNRQRIKAVRLGLRVPRQSSRIMDRPKCHRLPSFTSLHFTSLPRFSDWFSEASFSSFSVLFVLTRQPPNDILSPLNETGARGLIGSEVVVIVRNTTCHMFLRFVHPEFRLPHHRRGLDITRTVPVQPHGFVPHHGHPIDMP
jgi:hypothetical protein